VEELRVRGASVLIVGCAESDAMSLPESAPDPLVPITAVVRGQQLAYELAKALDLDPDSPGGLTKVTAT
jgi:glucosamine 6-phosphate synthetase-like amidotransferase/phosphosugar isomerase protein